MGMVLAVGVVALYRDQVEPAMAHATFGAQALGKGPHLVGRAFEQQAFQAVVMVQVAVLAGDGRRVAGP